MRVEVLETVAVNDYTSAEADGISRPVFLEPGAYELEEVAHPVASGATALLVAGTRLGGRLAGWQALQNRGWVRLRLTEEITDGAE